MTKCPICEKGVLKKKQVEEKMFGVSLGKFTAEVCDKCDESYLDESAMKKIETKAKELGIWGLAKDIKIVKSGNSLSVRIPAKIVHFMELFEGEDMLLYPEGKKKIIIEVT